jgi:hypothetical protein
VYQCRPDAPQLCTNSKPIEWMRQTLFSLQQAIVRRKSESEASGSGNLSSAANGVPQGEPSQMAGLETRGFAPSFGMPGEPGPGPDPFGPGRASYGARTAPGGQFGEAGGLGDFGGLPGEMQDASPPGEEPNGKAF